MPKITNGTTVKISDIIKQKKLEQKKILKEKEAAIQAAKELKFDEFVRKTAREMIDPPKKYQLQVFNEAESLSSEIPCNSFGTSIWAPWNKFLRK